MVDVSRPQSPAPLDAVFFALSDGTRRGLLGRLRGAELTAGALAEGFQVTRPAVSRHLRILREARLVSERRRGRERVYRLTPEPLAGATGWLDDYRMFWAARLHELKSFIEALPDDDPALAPTAATSPSPATSSRAASADPAAPSLPSSSRSPR
jgi:DNA-binding transcriptional ArsR family regulator